MSLTPAMRVPSKGKRSAYQRSVCQYGDENSCLRREAVDLTACLVPISPAVGASASRTRDTYFPFVFMILLCDRKPADHSWTGILATSSVLVAALSIHFSMRSSWSRETSGCVASCHFTCWLLMYNLFDSQKRCSCSLA